MNGKDWNNLGSDLNRIIEDAVHMRNFGRLNESINDTIRKAFRGMAGEEVRSGGGWDFDLSKNGREQRNTAASIKPTANSNLFAGSGKRKTGAGIMFIVGILVTVSSFVPLNVFFIQSLIGLSGAGTASIVLFAIMLAAGITCIVKGRMGIRFAKRFEQYVRSLGGQMYSDVNKLALYCHKTEKEVVKDLKKMLRKGWFLQGHMDRSEKCLIVSDEAYQQYLDAVKNAQMQEEEKQKQNAEQAGRNGGLTPEVKAVLQKGNEYILSIRKSNDAIPGEEISEKIYRIELLVRRIFQQTEAHPENVQDLDKFMEYYLPMTIKLLKAYEELDRQQVQGENIVSSKHEIENTLDTLNMAFEKLLDNLFRDTAWDVSSDISVLQTLLAQEGLTDKGFGK